MRLLPCIVLLVPALGLAQDAAVRLDDLGTRLQFDAYAADGAAVTRDLASLTAMEVPDSLAAVKATLVAYGAWQQSEMPGMDPAVAADSARQCLTEIGRAIDLDPKRAALHAMLSTCQRRFAGLQGRVKAPLATGRARQSMDRALQLSPRDPHVLLLRGLELLDRVRAGEGEAADARMTLVAATAAFDTASQSPESNAFAVALGWGVAESWNALGQLEQLAGNPAAARDAFERALVLVEGYRDVQERLKQLTASPDAPR